MKKLYRRSISGLLALLICFTAILGSGMTAYAAAFTGETADSYSVAFPRDGDANLDYSGTWGHDELHYMNGWTSGEATWMTTLHTIGSFDGPACYCIEPGVPRNLYRSYESYGEDYWDTFPAEYNRTIDGRTMKTLLGRIMQYGYQGNLSLDWRSQNKADADKLAHMMATQVLVWETVVGERDADFNHVDPGSADAVKSVYRTSHPLYSRFSAYYDSIEASVKKHTVVPSFMDRSEEAAQTVELSWDGGRYTATLTDTNGVLGEYAFSSAQSDMTFAVDGNDLTISAETASADGVTITAVRNNTRQGVVVWSDGHYGPDGTMQDVVTFRDTVSDPMYAYLHLKVGYGSVKIIKTSEDGEVSGISFTVSGNGTEQTVTTNADGEMQLDDLRPGAYTVTEQSSDRYEPQEVRQVTVISGQIATVTFHNTLKRGSLEVIKTSEDHLIDFVLARRRVRRNRQHGQGRIFRCADRHRLCAVRGGYGCSLCDTRGSDGSSGMEQGHAQEHPQCAEKVERHRYEKRQRHRNTPGRCQAVRRGLWRIQGRAACGHLCDGRKWPIHDRILCLRG